MAFVKEEGYELSEDELEEKNVAARQIEDLKQRDDAYRDEILPAMAELRSHVDDMERVWVSAPYHPVARGLDKYFELPGEETYGEPFGIPTPEETVFIGWFTGGEVFRSGCSWQRGNGKVFYFQPGHETYPTYFDPNVQTVIRNAVRWVAPTYRIDDCMDCPCLPKAHKWE